MSRIGQMPVKIPSGVTVKVENSVVFAKGPKGELNVNLPELISASMDGDIISVTRATDSKTGRSLHGLMRSLVANMLQGVAEGFEKQLEIQGVGFKAEVQGRKVILSLGFASPKEYNIPDGVEVTEAGGTKITITGADKQQVGECAASIRLFFPVEPYKGKGIRYVGEHVKRKVGKTVA